ncbi:uncharacterized protein EV422DRAFT_226367 [Fimicolochytrium jonesii]|uniref:uncharacterized protein n=1 Tax=Fimicolochytrium jonesii TaxID=1396493 RepID=UPI0022FDBB49|nr:uncharacterized protein EV422DRAFT_226367 [Fimicolochytrium jonesii]KAI8817482.1 hypothetical protein EV422DRAFT_226367 [Fimicolochytrium jonesii]
MRDGNDLRISDPIRFDATGAQCSVIRAVAYILSLAMVDGFAPGRCEHRSLDLPNVALGDSNPSELSEYPSTSTSGLGTVSGKATQGSGIETTDNTSASAHARPSDPAIARFELVTCNWFGTSLDFNRAITWGPRLGRTAIRATWLSHPGCIKTIDTKNQEHVLSINHEASISDALLPIQGHAEGFAVCCCSPRGILAFAAKRELSDVLSERSPRCLRDTRPNTGVSGNHLRPALTGNSEPLG